MNAEDLKNYVKDARGNLVHIDNIKEIDKLRDELVKDIHTQAIEMNDALRALKDRLFKDIAAFVSLSLEKYQVKRRGKKGNMTFYSFDGSIKVVYAICENIRFDERILAAKELIDECLKEWTENARTELKTIIDEAFNVDKEGNLNTGRILSLRRLEIEDERWLRAMDAISDSIQLIDTKPYIRIYERMNDDSYRQISLDFAGV